MSKAADNRMPAWLNLACNSREATRFEIPASGDLTVFPAEQRYSSNISDWGALWEADAADVNVSVATEDIVAPASTSPVEMLCWTLNIERARSRPNAAPLGNGLLRLESWPPLTHLPGDTVATVARICALLACRPSVAMMVPLLLGEPSERVYPLLEALHACAYVQTPEAGSGAAAVPDAADLPQAALAAPSLIAKLWQRLAGH